jgi:hypothetical protein
LANYTLVGDSSSAQAEATFGEPRMILYGEDARLIIAMTSSPDQVHGYGLETMEFRPETREWRLREFLFSRNGSPPVAGEVNDPSCVRCHDKNDPRPNVDPYAFWKGWLAGKDDELGTGRAGDLTPYELDLSARLSAAQATHPRLAMLIDLDIGYQRHPDSRTNKLHNINFTGRVARLNDYRIARLLEATPDWDKFQYATLGSLWCNLDKPAEWLTPEVAARLSPKNIVAPYPTTTDRYGKPMELEGPNDGAFDLLFEQRGISTAGWSMTFGGTHEFGTPGGFSEEMTYALSQSNPALRPYVQQGLAPYGGGAGEGYHSYEKAEIRHKDGQADCESLRQASLAAFAAK